MRSTVSTVLGVLALLAGPTIGIGQDMTVEEMLGLFGYDVGAINGVETLTPDVSLDLPGWHPITIPEYSASGPPILIGSDDEFLGTYSSNPYDPTSVSNLYGTYGSPYSQDSINNPYGVYGSPYSSEGSQNPYTTGGAKLYSPGGEYLGRVNSNPYDSESISNPYGVYGSPYSAKSVNNPYGTYGSPYSPNSATNPYATSSPWVLPTFDD